MLTYRTRSSSRPPTSPIPWDTGSILWDWWKDAAGSNSALADQIRRPLKIRSAREAPSPSPATTAAITWSPESSSRPMPRGMRWFAFRTDDVPHTDKGQGPGFLANHSPVLSRVLSLLALMGGIPIRLRMGIFPDVALSGPP